MQSWSKEVLERYAAPGIDEFIKADVPELRAEFPDAQHWIADHFLNTVLGGEFSGAGRQYVLNFIRRACTTFDFYGRARDATLKYLDGNYPTNPKIGRYYEAVSLWEVVLLNWAIGVDLLRTLTQKNAFEKGDGSPEQRAYSLHNTIKHHAADIRDGTLAANDTIALWMMNDGLHSKAERLSFLELGELVRGTASLAERFKDPLNFADKGGARGTPLDPV